MEKGNVRLRLTVALFLEFGVWGLYLSSIGRYMDNVGLGSQIKWYFVMQGLVTIFMPTLMGIIADRYIQAQKLLALDHLLTGIFLMCAGLYCHSAGSDVHFAPFFVFTSLAQAFFMPTLSLSSAVSFNALTSNGLDTVRYFPSIRCFGTVGFVCGMLLSNWVRIGGVSMQDSYTQLIAGALGSFVYAAYALTLPQCPVSGKTHEKTLAERLGLKAFSLFRDRQFAVFLIFAMLLGAALKITEAYASPFLNSFRGNPVFADTFAVRNSNALLAVSQTSEALCILLIPFFMKRFGIKIVMLTAMLAWMLRFALFAVGNPGTPGIIWLILSCIIYGVAFNFFDVAGSLFMDRSVSSEIRASAQGLYMLMASGLGSVVGTLCAGAVVDKLIYNTDTPSWPAAWAIFAGYSLVLAIAFVILYKPERKL